MFLLTYLICGRHRTKKEQNSLFLRLLRDWADASLQWQWRRQRQQGQQCQRNEEKSTHAMRAMTPVQRWQQEQCNVGDDTGAMRPRTPAQHQQRHQRCIRRTIKKQVTVESWNNARYGNEAMGKNDDHDNDATHMDVSRLRLGWADASL